MELIADALEQDMIPSKEVPSLSSFIVKEMEKVNTHEELINFLRVLSSKWSVFSYLLVVESGEVQEKKDEEVAEAASELAKEGKIDEALNIVREEIKISNGGHQ